MMYFKLIKDGMIFAVASTYDLRRYQAKHGIIISCDMSHAQYIQVGEDLYRDSWMVPVTGDKPFQRATIVEIDQSEYDELSEELAINTEIVVPEPEPDPVAPDEPDEPVEEEAKEPSTMAQQLQKQINELQSQIALAARYAKV